MTLPVGCVIQIPVWFITLPAVERSEATPTRRYRQEDESRGGQSASRGHRRSISSSKGCRRKRKECVWPHVSPSNLRWVQVPPVCRRIGNCRYVSRDSAPSSAPITMRCLVAKPTELYQRKILKDCHISAASGMIRVGRRRRCRCRRRMEAASPETETITPRVDEVERVASFDRDPVPRT